jgi:N utilization substance protein B
MAASRPERSAARLFATQALFQMEASGQGADPVLAEFAEHRIGAEIDGATWPEADRGHLAALVQTAVARQAAIDQATDRALAATWTIDRIDPVMRALFRAGGAELLLGGTPVKVVINEFVDVARAFFPGGKEAGFVNAVLDHMARDLRPEGLG